MYIVVCNIKTGELFVVTDPIARWVPVVWPSGLVGASFVTSANEKYHYYGRGPVFQFVELVGDINTAAMSMTTLNTVANSNFRDSGWAKYTEKGG